eukprot:5738216-Prymnesium_polylepis.2
MPRARDCSTNRAVCCLWYRCRADSPRATDWIRVAAWSRRRLDTRAALRLKGSSMRVAAWQKRTILLFIRSRWNTRCVSMPSRNCRLRRTSNHRSTRTAISSADGSPSVVSRSRKASWPARKKTRVRPRRNCERSMSSAIRMACAARRHVEAPVCACQQRAGLQCAPQQCAQEMPRDRRRHRAAVAVSKLVVRCARREARLHELECLHHARAAQLREHVGALEDIWCLLVVRLHAANEVGRAGLEVARQSIHLRHVVARDGTPFAAVDTTSSADSTGTARLLG